MLKKFFIAGVCAGQLCAYEIETPRPMTTMPDAQIDLEATLPLLPTYTQATFLTTIETDMEYYHSRITEKLAKVANDETSIDYLCKTIEGDWVIASVRTLLAKKDVTDNKKMYSDFRTLTSDWITKRDRERAKLIKNIAHETTELKKTVVMLFDTVTKRIVSSLFEIQNHYKPQKLKDKSSSLNTRHMIIRNADRCAHEILIKTQAVEKINTASAELCQEENLTLDAVKKFQTALITFNNILSQIFLTPTNTVYSKLKGDHKEIINEFYKSTIVDYYQRLYSRQETVLAETLATITRERESVLDQAIAIIPTDTTKHYQQKIKDALDAFATQVSYALSLTFQYASTQKICSVVTIKSFILNPSRQLETAGLNPATRDVLERAGDAYKSALLENDVECLRKNMEIIQRHLNSQNFDLKAARTLYNQTKKDLYTDSIERFMATFKAFLEKNPSKVLLIRRAENVLRAVDARLTALEQRDDNESIV